MNIFRAAAVRSLEEATRAIPVIDFGPAFRANDRAVDDVATAVRDACERVGFFYMAGHGVPQATIDAAFEAAREFHALPLADKMQLRINENNIGYPPVNQSMQRASTVHKNTRPNFNESFFISHDRGADHPDVLAGKPLRGRNQWPAGHERDAERDARLSEKPRGRGLRMLPVLSRALEMPADYFGPFFTDEAHVNLRFLHYPPRTPKTTSSSARARTPTTRSSRFSRGRRCGGSPCGCRTANGLRRPLFEGRFS